MVGSGGFRRGVTIQSLRMAAKRECTAPETSLRTQVVGSVFLVRTCWAVGPRIGASSVVGTSGNDRAATS